MFPLIFYSQEGENCPGPGRKRTVSRDVE